MLYRPSIPYSITLSPLSCSTLCNLQCPGKPKVYDRSIRPQKIEKRKTQTEGIDDDNNNVVPLVCYHYLLIGATIKRQVLGHAKKLLTTSTVISTTVALDYNSTSFVTHEERRKEKLFCFSMISVVGHTHATVQCRTRKIQRRRRRHSTVPLPSTTGFTIARVLFCCCCFIDPCGSAQFRTRNRTISEAARLPHDNHPAVLAFPILRKRNVFGSTDHPIFYSHFFKPVALRCAESSRRARTTTNEYGCAPRAVSRIHLHKLK